MIQCRILANYFDIKKSDLVENHDNFNITISSTFVFVYGTIPTVIPMECIEDIIYTEEISVDILKEWKTILWP